jgi:hypothetical protein
MGRYSNGITYPQPDREFSSTSLRDRRRQVTGARPRKAEHDRERELADEARLLQGWHAFHRDERKVVLAGPHGAMFERLLFILKGMSLTSAPLLLAYVRGVDWPSIDMSTRLNVLHEINTGITNLRARHGLSPFDDGIERDSVFCLIREILFPAHSAAPPGAQPGLMSK